MDTSYTTTLPIWEDETNNISNIEGLHLPSDRKWKTCQLKVSTADMCFLGKAQFDLTLQVGNTSERISFSLSANKEKYLRYIVDKTCTINVMGSMSVLGFPPARGRIELSATYDKIDYESTSVSWRDRTAGNSFVEIEQLTLPAQEKPWDHCEIRIDADKNATTQATLSLLTNGTLYDIHQTPTQSLIGAQTKIFTLNDINSTGPLMVTGYISNKLIGAGATVTLTGFYKGE